MCGLVAFVAYASDAPPVDMDALVRVRDAMTARGPDAAGVWRSDDGRVAMGHRRLSIIDLSERGDQPMISSDGRLAIVFNGEIYNYTELRDQLKADYAFATDSDTEVVMAAYRADPDHFLDSLQGMYALVIRDSARQQTVAARDPYGIKPLYYADDGRTLRLASQVRALRQSSNISSEIDPEATYGFFCWGYVPEPRTLYRSISALPAGHRLVLKDGGAVRISAFADVAEVFAGTSGVMGQTSAEATASIASALRRSVSRHLVADVPVGVFLSAGIDSTSIASELCALSPTASQAVTLSFAAYAGTDRDESALAAVAANELGMEHHLEQLDEATFLGQLEAALGSMDQPSIDGLNTYFVSQAAKHAGLKTVMSGVGGDELFAGYSIFRDLPRWHRIRRLLPAQLPLAPALRGLVDAIRKFEQVRLRLPPKLAGLGETTADMRDLYALRRGVFLPHEARRLVHETTGFRIDRDLHPTDVVQWHESWRGRPTYRSIAAAESTLYMRNQLLRDADWASMAHSLELRTPLVDYTLLREVLPVLCGQSQITKALLTSTVPRAFDRSIRERPKTGFGTPIDEWIVRSGLLGGRVAEHRSSRDWARFVFERYLDGGEQHPG